MGHWKGEGFREQLVKNVLEEFSYIHPDIDVEFKFAADVLEQKSQKNAGHYIANMIRSGNLAWDVVWLDPLIYHHVAVELDDWNWGRKHLVDFSSVPGMAARQKPFLVEGPEAHRHTAGILSGPYIEGYFYTVWYNQETAERLGIRVREDGMTPSDLLGYLEKIKAYNQTAEKPVAAFLDYEGSGALTRLFYSLFYSGHPEENFGISGTAAEDAEKVAAKVVDWFEKFGNACGPFAVLAEETWPAAGQALLDGQALFYFDATWRYTAFEQLAPAGVGRLRLAQFPEFEGHRHVIGGYIPIWAVLKNAPGRDDAIELMEYWSRPAIAEKWVRNTKCPTGLTGNLYDPIFGNDIHGDFQRRMDAGNRHWIPDPLMFPNRFEAEVLKVPDEVISQAVALLQGMPAPQ